MTRLRHGMAAALDRLLWLGDAAVVLSSIAFTILIILQVLFRYLLRDSIIWAEEMVRLLLYFTVLTGMGPTAARMAHIALDGVEKLVPVWARGPMALLRDAVTIGFCCAFVWYSAQLISLSWIARTPFMGIPMGWVYLLGLPGVLLCIAGTVRAYLAPPSVNTDQHLQDLAT